MQSHYKAILRGLKAGILSVVLVVGMVFVIEAIRSLPEMEEDGNSLGAVRGEIIPIMSVKTQESGSSVNY